MTDYPSSTIPTDGYLAITGKLWRAFQAKRAERAERHKLGKALREFNSAHLRDIGYVREDILDTGNSRSASDQAGCRAGIIKTTF